MKKYFILERYTSVSGQDTIIDDRIETIEEAVQKLRLLVAEAIDNEDCSDFMINGETLDDYVLDDYESLCELLEETEIYKVSWIDNGTADPSIYEYEIITNKEE